MNGISRQPRLVGLLCGAAAAGLGLAYMTAAGAPSVYLLVNLAALILGASLWLALGRAARSPLPLSGALIVAGAAALLATALLGAPVEGAARWVTVGPLTLQLSLILLPAMLVLYARRPDAVGTAGVIAAALALALQPDRAMAGVLAAVLAALVLVRRDRISVLPAAASLAGFGWTLVAPDRLPAVPYVDRIFYTAFDVHPLAGLAVLAGALALLVPALAGRAGGDRPVLLVFGACWGGILLAAALGDYPTPVVGYGGSAVLGYLLSAALLPAAALRRGASTGSTARPPRDRAPDDGRSELGLA